MRRIAVTGVALLFVGALVAAPAATRPDPALETRIAALESRVTALEALAWPTAAPTPVATASSAPTASATAAPTPTPTTTMLGDLSGLPTSGSAWTYLRGQADATWPAPDICNQDNKTGVQALAAGMVYARIGGDAYRAKVVTAVTALRASQRDGCTNAALSAGRQLGAWVLASDLVGYRDPAWLAFLTDMRTRNLGGHGRWTSLDYTAGDSSNNWGAFAQGALATIDRYLGLPLDTARVRFRGFTGDRGAYVFRNPTVSPGWVCGTAWTPIQVCPGDDRDGAPAEDAHRSGDYPAISRTYVQETMQGLALAAEMLGEWERLRPLAGFASRWAVWNASSVGYHVPWWYNARLGTSVPTQAAGYGRTFGFTDWYTP